MESRQSVIVKNGGRFKVVAVYGRDGYGPVPFHHHYTDCALEGVLTGERVQADCNGMVPIPGDVWQVKAAGPCWHSPYVLTERCD